MGKKKGGHKKTKAPLIRTAAKVILVVAGGKMILDSDVIDLAKVHLNDPKQVTGNPVAAIKEYVSRVAPGAVVMIGGPKAVDIVYKAIPLPEIKRAKVPGSSRKVV